MDTDPRTELSGGPNSETAQSEDPAQVIRTYLAEQDGAVTVPVHNLLSTWSMENAPGPERKEIEASLEGAGVNLDRSLETLAPEDEVHLELVPGESRESGPPHQGDEQSAQRIGSAEPIAEAAPPAGWYPDPEHAGRERYWDGRLWSEYRRPFDLKAPAGIYPDPSGRMGWRRYSGRGWTNQSFPDPTPGLVEAQADVELESLLATTQTEGDGEIESLLAARQNEEPSDGERVAPEEHPAALKAAVKAHDAAIEGYRAATAAAENRLKTLESGWETKVASHRKALEKAEAEIKLGSLGVVRRVTLYETSIQTPDGTFELSPQVRASADQHGNKQVVQGWVFKSDQDRREVYLHISGPGWGSVVPFSIQHSLSQPRDIHNFANQINVAAQASPTRRVQKAERVRGAKAAYAAALLDRRAVEEAVPPVLSAARDTAGLVGTRDKLAGVVAQAPSPDHRRVRKANEKLGRVEAELGAALQIARNAQARVNAASTAARKKAEKLTKEPENAGPSLPPTINRPREGAPSAVATTPAQWSTSAKEADPGAGAEGADKSEVLALLKQLGELKDAGVLTEEEFASKKADLLDRL
jgi:putative oligomerization/nucleic acid binding protein/uncharacterized protein DUF2510